MRTADLARELLSVSSVLTMETAVKDIRRRKHGTQFYRHTKVNSAAVSRFCSRERKQASCKINTHLQLQDGAQHERPAVVAAAPQ